MPSNFVNTKSLPLLCLAAACLSAVMGCQTTHVPQSVLARDSGNDASKQLDYWHDLATKQLISNDEAFHGVLLYLDGKDDATTYEQRVASLKSRGYLPQGFNQVADAAVERGTLAVPIAKSLHLKGGLTMQLLGGMSPRYATRELVYRDIYPTSGVEQVFTGAEFVGVIGKAEDYRLSDPTNLPAADMPKDQTAQNDSKSQIANQKSQISDQDDAVAPILAMIAPENFTLGGPTTATAAATTTPSGSLKGTITAVQGLCTVRADENSPWQPAKIGMTLNESSEFRTGPTGTLQFRIEPDQTISIDRLTAGKLLQAVQKNGKVTTDIGIKYGRTRYDLEGGGLEHQSTLRSPNATLAVRGTKVSLFDQPPFAPQAVSLTGRAAFSTQRHHGTLAFGNRGQGKTVVTSNSQNAGDFALKQTIVDPTLNGARTDSEQGLLATVISRGANVSIDQSSGIEIVHGGIPPTDAQLIPVLPGKVNFLLRWQGNFNLDLGVATPGETVAQTEFIYPARGVNVSTNGKTAFDHQGGPNGGIEIVYFNTLTDGIYKIAGRMITPGGTTSATLEAFIDGKQQQLGDLNNLTLGQVVTKSNVGLNNDLLGLLPVDTTLPFAAAARTASGRPAATLMGPLPINPAAPTVFSAAARTSKGR